MHGIRRTADGIILSGNVVNAIVGIFGVLAILSTFGLSVWKKAERVEHAVQDREFYDTTRAIRSDLATALRDARAAIDRSTSISCFNAGYPAGLCDDVQRPASRKP